MKKKEVKIREPARNMEDIAAYLEGIRFKRKLFGGADEEDVWAVIGRLQEQFRSVLAAQEQYFRGLMEERDDQIARLRGQNRSMKAGTETQQTGMQARETGGDGFG